jgi:hypothetical protein
LLLREARTSNPIAITGQPCRDAPSERVDNCRQRAR